MFCDLVGSTSISAGLDAEEWRDLVIAYLDAASAAVTEMGGHVAKKLGDGLMALFGYPVAQENDAERAARAALSIQRALAELNRKNAGFGQAGAERAHRHRNRPGSGRCRGRDLRRCTERGGASAGAGRARHGYCDGEGAAPDRWLFRRRGVRHASVKRRTRAGDAVPARPGQRWRTALGQRQLTPLVGRDEEIAMLMRRWERARQGDGQLVLIVGEPGLGKSRLIEEFHARLREIAAHLGGMELLAALAEHAAASGRRMGPHAFRWRRCALRAATCRPGEFTGAGQARSDGECGVARPAARHAACRRNAHRLCRRRNCGAGNWRR